MDSETHGLAIYDSTLDGEHFDLCKICGYNVRGFVEDMRNKHGTVQDLMLRIGELKNQKTLDEFPEMF